jgi:hypothetical protein
MLNRVFENNKSTQIKILESEIIHPLAKEKCWELTKDENAFETKEQLKSNGSYAIHYFWGTWWRKQNPFKL